MDSASHMEIILSHVLGEVLVAGNTTGFQSLRGDLLDLVGDDMDDEGEVGSRGLLATDIVNTDLGVRHTTVVA
jgi:hypothetical protein